MSPQHPTADKFPSSATATSIVAAISPPSSIPARTNYPNPGYLGASSHAAIFSQLSENEVPINEPSTLLDNTAQSPALESPLGLESEIHAAKVAGFIEALSRSFSAAAFKNLVCFWRATGANLALAEPLVDLCLNALDDLHSLSTQDKSDQYVSYARLLLRNSSRPLPIQSPLTLEDFCLQAQGSKTRLEILGLLICAVIRASSEIYPFPPLYLDGTRQQELMALAVKLTDAAVEAILSLDTLNDLQLVFQYENFISYSYVFGVQSYYSYRKLGDVITSIATLGYHEKLGPSNALPEFLINIRRTALARTYSADKNWSIFLGRPPRLGKEFCHLSSALRESVGPENGTQSPPDHAHEILSWQSDSRMSVWAETRWTAVCASLKEEILGMFSEEIRENLDERVRDELRMEAHYGLPAIGIIMIAMLKKRTLCDALKDAQTIRDLGIIVTVVDLGTIVRPMEPNYALLSRAVGTIKKFLARFNTQDQQNGLIQDPDVPQTISEGGFWGLQCQLEPWDFEMNFWDNLAEHPSMFSPDIE
ncbi:hypothetical protein IL306_009741 [Fusarium sp. DS 682]|nr:hypothetical protein IL306_009741 [Fusarium sp. DS 682]